MRKVTVSVPDGMAKFLREHKFTPKEQMVSIALFFYPFVYDQKMTMKEVGDCMGLSKEDILEIYRFYEVEGKHSSVLDDLDFVEKVYFKNGK